MHYREVLSNRMGFNVVPVKRGRSRISKITLALGGRRDKLDGGLCNVDYRSRALERQGIQRKMGYT